MEALGYIFLVLLALAVIVAVITLVSSIPDIRRYLAISRM
jgi:hypothetical protein